MQGIKSGRRVLGVFRELLAYLFAAKMVVFGAAKIFGTQFQLAERSYNIPLGELSGYELMWGFFGRHYELSLLIGLTELFIAIFVVFPRTRLFGLMIAVPVFINLLAMNTLFELGFLIIRHTIIDCLVIGFLLYPYRGDLFRFFYRDAGRLPAREPLQRGKFMRTAPWIFACVLVPLYFIAAAVLIRAYG